MICQTILVKMAAFSIDTSYVNSHLNLLNFCGINIVNELTLLQFFKRFSKICKESFKEQLSSEQTEVTSIKSFGFMEDKVVFMTPLRWIMETLIMATKNKTPFSIVKSFLC